MISDTIFALSTLAGKSGVAVVRISGGMALAVAQQMGLSANPIPRLAHYTKLLCPFSQELLDHALVMYFKGPNSFTGEDVVELHLHGSIAVIQEVMLSLGQHNYLRLAEPGEFSKRAFLNGKMDLTAAEGLADLIEAETAMQRKVALRQMNGELENLYEKWRKDMISILSRLEALIDFPEEDIPLEVLQQSQSKIHELAEQILNHLNDNNRGEIISRGVQVAIIGKPNVGKSSLLNTIARKDIAIVSDIAGTTRDVIDVKIDLGGFPVVLFDTAGIRETEDVIEKEGVRRALKVHGESDITVVVLDASDASSADVFDNTTLQVGKTIVVMNKTDLSIAEELSSRVPPEYKALNISIKNALGTDLFLKSLLDLVKENYSPGLDPMVSRVRHRNYLLRSVESLSNFSFDMPLDMATEEIRYAAHSLGMITGRIDVEEILDEIFSSFCIGK